MELLKFIYDHLMQTFALILMLAICIELIIDAIKRKK